MQEAAGQISKHGQFGTEQESAFYLLTASFGFNIPEFFSRPCFNKTGGNWIYVVDEATGVAYKREIRIGNQSDRSYEVLEGLEEGETVVTSSYDAYNDIDQLILQ